MSNSYFKCRIIQNSSVTEPFPWETYSIAASRLLDTDHAVFSTPPLYIGVTTSISPMSDQPLTSALEFTFRAATPADAPFIARYVLAAFHIIELDKPLSEEQQQSITALEPVVQQEGVLYSYRHAEIVEIKGEPIAMLLSYKGENFREFRARTFQQLPFFTEEELASMDDETQAGELYIDSLAVHPQHRGCGIARCLLERAVHRAKSLDVAATLLVDPENTKARALYERCGFTAEGRVNAFGVNFHRLVHR